MPIDLEKIITAIHHFSDLRLLVVGDVMLDEYLWGNVERISPEAPVQVVDIRRQNFTLGGAANVVNNLISLGSNVYVAAVIGNDDAGEIIKDEFKRLNVNIDGLFTDTSRPTTKKTRVMAINQQMIRLDYEKREEISRDLEDKINAYIKDNLSIFDAILVSDYAKGVVTRGILTEVIKKKDGLILIDPKGRDFSKYRGATAITPNIKEAILASGFEDIEKAARKFLDELDLKVVFITRGKRGISLFERGRPPVHVPARAREVYDVSGAGDTVLATLGLSIASGLTYFEAALLANIAAGIVVGKVGTATVTQEELLDALVSDTPFSASKIKEINQLKQIVNYLKAQGKKIVFTNGCFDLLHVGHIHLLKESKRLGDILIVAIDDDESVRRLKGEARPVINQFERAQILSALDCIDYVTIFSTDQLKDLIEEIRPDILTKGSDYKKEDVVGREIVEGYGGRVALIPVAEGISSSKIINNIVNNGMKVLQSDK
ncbi:MAG: D-glycero-beta-D-manno-heptose-7-phosphate kinase [Deltaproteobacteria bacterium]|nr:D-glycero-beta-D-manno-heptose-7-phosphate kinase [Deltaproteobacteria bacterium]